MQPDFPFCTEASGVNSKKNTTVYYLKLYEVYSLNLFQFGFINKMITELKASFRFLLLPSRNACALYSLHHSPEMKLSLFHVQQLLFA